ncbi:MAG: SDR family NAD(P)-dependent oxidoreductase [Rhodospirillaceae bacterium]
MPGTIHPLVLDVTDGEACRAAPAQAAQLAGRPIDYAVLNAGTHKPLRLKEFSAEAVRYLSEVNVIGTANCLEGLLPEMVDRKGGTIAVVASVAGYTGLPTASAYGASKAAVINMIESLKPEADAHGVRLLLVNPGFVRTPLTDKNTFEMPFLMEPEAAAARIARALARKGGFEVTFPRRFTCMMKLLSMLPYGLRFSLTRKTVPADE